MFAIVTIAGQQFKVEEGQELFVHQLEATAGDNIAFDQVHLMDNDGKVSVGTPVLDAKVMPLCLEHVKGDKVIVFKKKRRKGYRRKNGPPPARFTKIKVDSIAV
jgi:large subunit ribosomal protein L21